MASSGLLSKITIRLVKCGSSLVVKQVRQWIPISQRNKIFQKYDLHGFQFPIDCKYCYCEGVTTDKGRKTRCQCVSQTRSSRFEIYDSQELLK